MSLQGSRCYGSQQIHKVAYAAAAPAAAKLLQSCPTLCDPIDGSPPGSSVHGIFQARVLEWVAIAFSDTATGLHPKNKQRHVTAQMVDNGQVQVSTPCNTGYR